MASWGDGLKFKLQTYADTEEVDLPWLQSAPSHWEVRRAKQVFRCIDIRSKTGDEELLTVSSADGVRKRSSKAVTMFMAESYVGHKLCWEGDLVVNSLWAWATGLGFSRYHGIISTAYSVYRPKPAYSENWEFFHHLFRSRPYDWEFTVRSKGIWISRLQMTDESFMQMPVLVPPPDEQAQIVRFIRHLDQRVNQLIKTKRRLIELLNEQKQAIIHRAVTRGLDPAVPLKPSGIFWLPEIPAHWKPVRVKSALLNLNNRRIPLSSTERGHMTTREFDYYGASSVIDKVDNYIFDDELLLIAEDGANLVLRNLPLAVIARGKFWVNNHAHILKPKRGSLEYWAMLLDCVNYRPWISGAAQPKLTKDRLMAVPIPYPPEDEQLAIVDYVTAETAGIRLAIEKTKSEIDLIREYRTRIVADVVTGQLDVRHLDLPEVEESLIEAIDAVDSTDVDDLDESEEADQ